MFDSFSQSQSSASATKTNESYTVFISPANLCTSISITTEICVAKVIYTKSKEYVYVTHISSACVFWFPCRQKYTRPIFQSDHFTEQHFCSSGTHKMIQQRFHACLTQSFSHIISFFSLMSLYDPFQFLPLYSPALNLNILRHNPSFNLTQRRQQRHLEWYCIFF